MISPRLESIPTPKRKRHVRFHPRDQIQVFGHSHDSCSISDPDSFTSKHVHGSDVEDFEVDHVDADVEGPERVVCAGVVECLHSVAGRSSFQMLKNAFSKKNNKLWLEFSSHWVREYEWDESHHKKGALLWHLAISAARFVSSSLSSQKSRSQKFQFMIEDPNWSDMSSKRHYQVTSHKELVKWHNQFRMAKYCCTPERSIKRWSLDSHITEESQDENPFYSDKHLPAHSSPRSPQQHTTDNLPCSLRSTSYAVNIHQIPYQNRQQTSKGSGAALEMRKSPSFQKTTMPHPTAVGNYRYGGLSSSQSLNSFLSSNVQAPNQPTLQYTKHEESFPSLYSSIQLLDHDSPDNMSTESVLSDELGSEAEDAHDIDVDIEDRDDKTDTIPLLMNTSLDMSTCDNENDQKEDGVTVEEDAAQEVEMNTNADDDLLSILSYLEEPEPTNHVIPTIGEIQSSHDFYQESLYISASVGIPCKMLSRRLHYTKDWIERHGKAGESSIARLDAMNKRAEMLQHDLQKWRELAMSQ